MTSRRHFSTIFLVICLALITWLNFIPNVWALGGKLPELYQTAPEFTLSTNIGDGEISLSDYRGKWVVLYFYPKDSTPGCTIEGRRFQQDLPKYTSRNTQILGVSVDDIKSHKEFCDSEGLKFPLLADTDGTVSKAYGSWLNFFSVRHTFIIDPDGKLRKIFLGVKPPIHSKEVLVSLDELRQS